MSVKISRLYINDIRLMIRMPDFPVLSLPKLDDETIDFLKKVFDYNKPREYDGKSVIYLMQDLQYDRPTEMEKIFEFCKEYKDKTIIRTHPAQTQYLDKLVEFDTDHDHQMWEIISGDVITDECRLVAAFSTAQITPWIFFDKKPTLIFLDKYLGVSDRYLEEIYKKLREAYDGVILRPERLEELYESVNSE